MKTRKEIIDEAVRIRTEINQISVDADHWNHSVRKPHEDKINPDPNGEMAELAVAIDKMLDNEANRLRVLPSIHELRGLMATDDPPIRYDHVCQRCGDKFSNVVRDCPYCCVCQVKAVWE
jgi:hypothetical protein